MRLLSRAAALSLIPALAGPLAAQTRPAPASEVSEAELRRTVERLVAFGTRHTLSSQTDRRRGIGAANRWAAQRFREIGRGCGGCLTVVLPDKTVTGNRIPQPTRIQNVVAIQRGSERPNEVVIVQAHIDSRVTDVLDAVKDAPGANDNGSGSALVIEAARTMSRHRYPTTVIYALLSGEEQGLFGGALLAEWAKAQGYTVKAVLNNDIVGGSRGPGGRIDDASVRVFSEGPRADATAQVTAAQRRRGGENDSPSRNLSRFVDGVADRTATGLDVRQIWRTDRLGRGGDHLPFLDAGYPAIRFSVGVEDWDHQHQDVRQEGAKAYGDTVDEMDFAYLGEVTRLNIAALEALARAPMPPAAGIRDSLSADTTVDWRPVSGAARYIVRWRKTDEPRWAHAVEVPGNAVSATLTGVQVDDWAFGVSAVSAAGVESPVSSAVPGGQFAPIASPPAATGRPAGD